MSKFGIEFHKEFFSDLKLEINRYAASGGSLISSGVLMLPDKLWRLNMNTAISTAQKRFRAKREVEHFGFQRTFSARHGAWMFIGGVTVVALVAGILTQELPFQLSGPETVTAVVAVSAFILGYQQWNAARNEIALDKYYERLEITNQRLDDWPSARSLAGTWPVAEGSQQLEEEELFQRTMYVYRELDNLEYAVVKYKLGYMTAETALRCLRTFRARCQSSEFRDIALKCVSVNEGYEPATIEVVKGVCRKIPASDENKGGSAELYGETFGAS